MITGQRIPHPIPYQGSKRVLAKRILSFFPGKNIKLFEPFAGSAAVSIAAAANGIVNAVILNDANEPLMKLWERILHKPDEPFSTYSRLWHEQIGNEKNFYNQVRDEFNKSHNPDLLLYLLARCVKASVRYNSNGEFNQSPDNRRKGAKPKTMAKHIYGASRLLCDITTVRHGDFRSAISDAAPGDIIYMDPPYQGVCGKRDNRYSAALPFDDFVEVLKEMNNRSLSFIISYDGRTETKTYGNLLPKGLQLKHIDVEAGVSSQATLLGRKAKTIESLYLSSALVNRIGYHRIKQSAPNMKVQQSLF